MAKWKKYVYRKRGLSHVAEGSVCQDYVELSAMSPYVSVALADGIGLLKKSDLASESAVREANRWLLQNARRLLTMSNPEVKRFVCDEMLFEIQSAIKQRAADTGNSMQDMDCNLAFACLDLESGACVIGQLGDCAACVINRNGDSIVLTERSSSANSTNSVMSSTAEIGIKTRTLQLDDAENVGIILTSDGLENLIFRKNSELVCKSAELFFNMMQQENHETALDQTIDDVVDHYARQLRDDISIAMVSAAESEVTLPDDPYWLCKCGTKNSLSSNYCSNCETDVLKLYSAEDYDAYGSRDRYFLEMNRDPERERTLLERKWNVHIPAAAKDNDAAETVITEEPAWNSPEQTYADFISGGMEEEDEPYEENFGTYDEGPEYLPANEEPNEDPPVSTGRKTAPVPVGRDAGSASGKKASASTFQTKKEVLFGSGRDDDDPVPFNKPKGGHKSKKHEKPLKKDRHAEDEVYEKKPFRKESLLLIGSVIILALAFIIAMGWPGSDNRNPTEPSDLHGGNSYVQSGQDTDPTLPQQLAGNKQVLVLGDDLIYYGEVEAGVPHGAGILNTHGKYWIGEFKSGRLDGRFLIVDQDDPMQCWQEVYWYRNVDTLFEDEEPATEEETSAVEETTAEQETLGEGGYVLADDIGFLREEGDFWSEKVEDSFIPAGTVVYRTESEPQEDGSHTWVEIRCEIDGKELIGWIAPDKLESSR